MMGVGARCLRGLPCAIMLSALQQRASPRTRSAVRLARCEAHLRRGAPACWACLPRRGSFQKLLGNACTAMLVHWTRQV